MSARFNKRLRATVKANSRRHKWYRVLTAMAAVVVFITTYVLIMPAVTQKTETYCGNEEHEHTLQCYSNPEADVETAEVWQNAADNIKLKGNWYEDVVSIAKSQLGYQPSENNYLADEDGVSLHGYTRFGAFMNDPYGNWNSYFCAFVLNYAGVDQGLIPAGSNADEWRLNLIDNDYYNDSTYVPCAGDVVFLAANEETGSNRVAIVSELISDDETKEIAGIGILEGVSATGVVAREYDLDSPEIIGYGHLPQNPDWFELNAETRTGIQVLVTGLSSALPFPAEEITLAAEQIKSELAEELLAEALAENGSEGKETVLLDVSLYHGDELVEPEGQVYLSFVSNRVDELAEVYHIDEAAETVTQMETEVKEAECAVVAETDHFSTFALTLNPEKGKNVSAQVNAEWDDANGGFLSVTMTATSTSGNIFYNYDVFSGSEWTVAAGTWSAKYRNGGSSYVIDLTDAANAAGVNTAFRARVAANTALPENDQSGFSESFTIAQLLDSVKSGFSTWVKADYKNVFGGTEPTTLEELFDAFAFYQTLPTLSLTSGFDDETLLVNAMLGTGVTDPIFVWEYFDGSSWCPMTPDAADPSVLNASLYSSLTEGQDGHVSNALDGGKTVRCLVYERSVAPENIKASASMDRVNPLGQVYARAIEEINTGLGLNAYKVTTRGGKSATPNLSIGGKWFNDYFYYGNVARDKDFPFYDAASYSDYLAKSYLDVQKAAKAAGASDADAKSAALAAVKDIWVEHLFDLYDPNDDTGTLGHHTYYPGPSPKVRVGENSTYGDLSIEWPKDGGSSFHNDTSLSMPKFYSEETGEGFIKKLNYDYLDNGVDYDHFIGDTSKSVTADAAGDANEERTYNVDVSADAHATVVSPVAMLVTVQTSWQMFDYGHANAVQNDGTYTTIEVGAAQHNTEMANLYDVKQALIRLADYMDEHYPGNNLILGINEVQHGGSYNLIDYYATLEGSTKTEELYVTNNPELIRESLYSWDTFGNCEHVHYDTKAMEAAAKGLEDNLTGIYDGSDYTITPANIPKVAVIIGGGTENSSGTNGYGCALPWSTFKSKGMYGVYGIRTNVGEPLNSDNVMSWLDYADNNYGDPYQYDPNAASGGQKGGGGSSKGNFTKKYIAPNEDAVFNALVEIAETVMTEAMQLDVEKPDVFVEDFTADDTVNDEFVMDYSKPIVAEVTKDGSTYYKTSVTFESADFSNPTITFTTDAGTVPVYPIPVSVDGTSAHYEFEVAIPYTDYHGNPQTKTVTQALDIVNNADGTTYVKFAYGDLHNGTEAHLGFGIQAREDYIGSNNVLANKGTPDYTYQHTKLDESGAPMPSTEDKPNPKSYTLNCTDTPEVNVPIVFDAADGTSIRVPIKTPVKLQDLSLNKDIEGVTSITPTGEVDEDNNPTYEPYTDDGIADYQAITAGVHDFIDNYDQINGTVSYIWVTPDGKEHKVPYSLHVTDGIPDIDLPTAADLAFEWTPKTAGDYTAELKVVFTPDPVADNGKFSDTITATRVNARAESGKETIKAYKVGSPDGGKTTSLTVSKIWTGERGQADAAENRPDLTYRLYQDGAFYTLGVGNAANNWSYTFEDLPATAPDGHTYEYTTSEDPIDGYVTTIGNVGEIAPTDYWAEVPLSEVKLDGSEEYMIVAPAYEATTEEEYVYVAFYGDGSSVSAVPMPIDSDTDTTITGNYTGWTISVGTTNATSYMKAGGKYLNKDCGYANGTGDNTKLTVSGNTLKVQNNYLRITFDGTKFTAGKDGNINNASNFLFFEKNGDNNWTKVSSITNGREYLVVAKVQAAKVYNAFYYDGTATDALGLDIFPVSDDSPAELSDYHSYFMDDDYTGWKFNYTDGNAHDTNYVSIGNINYLKKDLTLLTALPGNNDARLQSMAGGKINIGGDYLLITYTDKDGYKTGHNNNANNATAFTFYKKVKNADPVEFTQAVTNTLSPTGKKENKTSITVKKTWGDDVAHEPLTIHLYQGSREIFIQDDTTVAAIKPYAAFNGNAFCKDGVLVYDPQNPAKATKDIILSDDNDWTLTFENLPYTDEVSGQVFEYLIMEEPVSGYEGSVTKKVIPDAGGGLHYVLTTDSSAYTLYKDTVYLLDAKQMVTGARGNNNAFNVDNSIPAADYLIGANGNTGLYEPFTTESGVELDGITYSEEVSGTIPSGFVWTAEDNNDGSYKLMLNGRYMIFQIADNKHGGNKVMFMDGIPSAGPGVTYLSAFRFDSAGRIYASKTADPDKGNYYLRYVLVRQKDGSVVSEARFIKKSLSDAAPSEATKFTVYEQIAALGANDTYEFDLLNVPTNVETPNGKIEKTKKIDYLGDGVENPDTGLSGNSYYRLYLDADGVRGSNDSTYPVFSHVIITDNLSGYVTLAGRGYNTALTIKKINKTDPADSTIIWYGDLHMTTEPMTIGSAMNGGNAVIDTVTYEPAELPEGTDIDNITLDSTGTIKVYFRQDYELEEGYRYEVSYNVELTKQALNAKKYDDRGQEGTDYSFTDTDEAGDPITVTNATSSGRLGLNSNKLANIIYNQDGEIKIGIYPHPVVQHPSEDPEQPPKPVYPDIPDSNVSIGKQIDYLGDGTAAGMSDLYRLYLSMDAEAQPIDLLLVVDQSSSMLFDMDGHTRQEYVENFLNGVKDDHTDGFIYQFRNSNPYNDLAILTFGSDSSTNSTADTSKEYDSARRYVYQWNTELTDPAANHVDLPQIAPSSDSVNAQATNYAAALYAADKLWDEKTGSTNQKIMIFLSDGEPTLAYKDGKMHNSFADPDNVVGNGSIGSSDSFAIYMNGFCQMTVQDVNAGRFAAEGSNRLDYATYSEKKDDFGNSYEAMWAIAKSDPDLSFPVVIDIKRAIVDIPGFDGGYLFGVLSTNEAGAFTNFYQDKISQAAPDNMTAWINGGTLSNGETVQAHAMYLPKYDIFYLSESAYRQFSQANSDVVTYTIAYGADGTYANGRSQDEVLKYMSGDLVEEGHEDEAKGRFKQCQNAQQLADFINGIAMLKDVSMTDTISKWVETESSLLAPIITFKDSTGEKTLVNGINDDGTLKFTADGTAMLDTTATTFDFNTGKIDVVFKNSQLFNENFTLTAAFTIRVTEEAFAEYEANGYDTWTDESGRVHTIVGDKHTDYPGNTTSSGKAGFWSNDNEKAKASWTRGGQKVTENFPKPVVQAKREPVVPIEPPVNPYPDFEAGVTVGKQIDYLGDNDNVTEGMEDLYRLYLSMDAEEKPIDLLLILDQSGSMNYGLDGTANPAQGESRQDILMSFLNGTAADHSDGFIHQFLSSNEKNNLAVLTFAKDCTYDNNYIYPWGNDLTQDSITATSPIGATNYTAALKVADQIWDEAPENSNQKIMIFLGDGIPTLTYKDGGLDCSKAALIETGSYSGRTIDDALGLYMDCAYWDANREEGRTDWRTSIFGSGFDQRLISLPQLSSGAQSFPAYPLVIDLADISLNVPGITEYPYGEFTDDDPAAFINWYNSVWKGFDKEHKIDWFWENASIDAYYDMFWLTEWSFNEFYEQHEADDIMVYSIGYSSETDGKIKYYDIDESFNSTTDVIERDRSEVLKYFAGDYETKDHPASGRFAQCDSAQELADAINSIALLKNIVITDTLSEYVEPAGADKLNLIVTLTEGSEDPIVLIDGFNSDGTLNFTNSPLTDRDGVGLLDQKKTSFDKTTGTITVAFKGDVAFNEDMNVTAAFNIRVKESAYEQWIEDGEKYPTETMEVEGQDPVKVETTGDANTDYPGNVTSVNKKGFRSNYFDSDVQDGEEPNPHASWTRGGSDGSEDFPKPVVQVFKDELSIKKVDAKDTASTPGTLAGAEFDIYRVYPLAKKDTESGKYTDEEIVELMVGTVTYPVKKVNSAPLVSASGTTINLTELYHGNYILVETKAPVGYDTLTEPLKFELARSGKIIGELDSAVAAIDNSGEIALLTVKNTSGYSLPKTGGIGAETFTLCGIMLMGIAVFATIRRKRREDEEI